MFNRSRKFAHFSKIWKWKEIRYLCYLPKNHGWPRIWAAGAGNEEFTRTWNL